MVRPPTPEFVSPPGPEEAITALRRIMRAWELDRFDATAMVGVAGSDLAAIDWTEDRLLRVSYLIEFRKGPRRSEPKGRRHALDCGPTPGPFSGGNSPLQMLTGSTREMA